MYLPKNSSEIFAISDVSVVAHTCSSNLKKLDLSGLILTGAVYVDDMFTDCSALQELKTPKKNEIDIDLPVLMYDSVGNEYETLPALSESIVLTREKPDISNCEITLSDESYIYDGKAKEPAVTVKSGNTTLTAGTHYTVSYADNTNVGTATVKVVGTDKPCTRGQIVTFLYRAK